MLLAEAAKCDAAGEAEQAVALLEYAVDHYPSSAQACAELARAYEKGGQVGDASSLYERVYSLDNTYPNVSERLAWCYNQLGQFDNTISVLERDISACGGWDDPDMYRALAMAYYKAQRVGEAIWALDRALAIRPDPKVSVLRRLWQQQVT